MTAMEDALFRKNLRIIGEKSSSLLLVISYSFYQTRCSRWSSKWFWSNCPALIMIISSSLSNSNRYLFLVRFSCDKSIVKKRTLGKNRHRKIRQGSEQSTVTVSWMIDERMMNDSLLFSLIQWIKRKGWEQPKKSTKFRCFFWIVQTIDC